MCNKTLFIVQYKASLVSYSDWSKCFSINSNVWTETSSKFYILAPYLILTPLVLCVKKTQKQTSHLEFCLTHGFVWRVGSGERLRTWHRTWPRSLLNINLAFGGRSKRRPFPRNNSHTVPYRSGSCHPCNSVLPSCGVQACKDGDR